MYHLHRQYLHGVELLQVLSFVSEADNCALAVQACKSGLLEYIGGILSAVGDLCRSNSQASLAHTMFEEQAPCAGLSALRAQLRS